MDTEYENILERLESKQAILFLGSGSTVQCRRPNDGKEGLTGHGLAKEILLELVGRRKPFPIPDNKVPSLMEAAEYFQSNHAGRRNALDKFIQNRLQGLAPTVGHYLATSFPWKAVITTNYNTVAEDAWSEATNHGYSASEVLPIKTDHDITLHAGETTKIRLYKPHGCLNLQMKPETRMVITSLDYARSESIRGEMYKAISSLASSSTTVFIGYSLVDYTFRNLYYRLFLELGEWQHQSFSIAPISPEQLFQWRAKAMQELKTTLLNTTFDVFMLNLVIARGTLHPRLKTMLKEQWDELTEANKGFMPGLRLQDFLKLRDEPSAKLGGRAKPRAKTARAGKRS